MISENGVKKISHRNLGIELLRMILCFWVLSFHCLNINSINYFLFFITKTKFYHVPCFCFISFYFSSKIFLYRNFSMFKTRIERLLIPYILWPILLFINNQIMHFFFNFSIYNLFSMEFQTIFFLILSLLFRKNFIFVAQLFGIFSYILQYSYKYDFLDNYKSNIRSPILDTISILPLSVIGINFASSKIINTFKSNSKKILFFSYLFLFCLFKYNLFIDMGGYKGIINIFSSVLFFVGFYLLPFEKLNPRFQYFIKLITCYTNGIYCLQFQVIPFVKSCFDRNGTFKSSIISYILLYFISFIGCKICGKTKFKYLFI